MSKCYCILYKSSLFARYNLWTLIPQERNSRPHESYWAPQNIYYVTPNSFLPLNMVKIAFSLAAIFSSCSHRIQNKFNETKPYK